MSDPHEALQRAVSELQDPSDPQQRQQALLRVSPALIDDVVFGSAAADLGAAADGALLAVGTPASPGIGVGRVIDDVSVALDVWEAGVSVVLVLDHTSPADEPAMRIASAIVTRSGGVSSHAGIIARQWGIPAVCGVGAVEAINGQQWLVDGATGEIRVLDDEVSPSIASRSDSHEPVDALSVETQTLLEWADDVVGGAMAVCVNADVAASVERGVRLGAAGVGMCRTEHQFLGSAGYLISELLAESSPRTIDSFVSHQCAQVRDVLIAAAGRPVTIRLLDAPSHEFDTTAKAEANPMLGLRGVRSAVVFPGLLDAQLRAIAGGFAEARSKVPETVAPIVLVPMVSMPEEVDFVAHAISHLGLDLALGAMIETPRAALCASMLASRVSHLCFGTNDLTQLTYGMSRDDSATLLLDYQRGGLISRDPFSAVDQLGVARLIALAVETARGANPNVTFSMCGEQAGDPSTIALAAQLGITTVSVSPYRVPAARLAAAHAILARG